MANPTLHVRILSPQSIILEADAQSVSSKNSQGSFDVLPQHANFITVIENSPITVRTAGQKPQTFKFPIAIMHVQSDKVDIYTYVQPETLPETKK